MTNNYYKGYDISSIQGANFSWQSIVDTGNTFIITRCGVGNGFIDNLYKQNISNAKSVGLAVGCYNFVYPLPPLSNQPLRDPVKQADYHFNAAGNEVQPFLDLEWPVVQDWQKWSCSAQQITDWTMTYLQEYERISGMRPIVYSYPSFLSSLKLPRSFADTYKLWIASYTTIPATTSPWLPNEWVAWQTGGGNLAKLSNGSPVDTDVCKDLSIFGATISLITNAPHVE